MLNCVSKSSSESLMNYNNEFKKIDIINNGDGTYNTIIKTLGTPINVSFNKNYRSYITEINEINIGEQTSFYDLFYYLTNLKKVN